MITWYFIIEGLKTIPCELHKAMSIVLNTIGKQYFTNHCSRKWVAKHILIYIYSKKCFPTSKSNTRSIRTSYLPSWAIPFKLKPISLVHNLELLKVQNNNGFSFAWSSKVFQCPKRLCCSLCRREAKEAICDSCIILEPTFISRFTKSSWRRIWIWTSHGGPHNSLHRRCLLRYYFSPEVKTSI